MSSILSFALPFAGCALMTLVCARMMPRGSTPTPPTSELDEAPTTEPRP